MEGINDADYTQAKRLCRDVEITTYGRYHDLYVKQYIIDSWCIWKLQQYVSSNIWAWSCKASFSPWITWQPSFKKAKVKLDLWTDIDMLLIVVKGIRGVICHSVYLYAKANNKYMKNYDKNKEPSYIQYWDVNNLYGWDLSKSFQ